jgi:hypothetical protein
MTSKKEKGAGERIFTVEMVILEVSVSKNHSCKNPKNRGEKHQHLKRSRV